MGLIPAFIGALVFIIVEAITFFFVVVATPISQVDTGNGCYTMWGYKSSCGKTRYSYHNSGYQSGRAKNNMNGAAAFAIISIVFTLVTLILGILMLIRVALPVVVTIIAAAVCVLTILISWACVADAHNSHFGGYFGGSFGAGFGLMVTAWVLQVLNLILILVMAFA